jgi:hypothetical protein
MKHYLYKITNIETKQYYVGVRSHKEPIIDTYMGSSSIWTKDWIKDNKDILIKEIIDDSFQTREDANIGEVELLQKCELDNFCINCLYKRIPSHLGVKQSEEWIAKRIHSGIEAPMYGKHHTEETKQKISNKLKGREISQEAKEKIGNFHRGKIVSEETRKKQSETKKQKIASGEIKKTYKPIIVEDLKLGTTEYFEGCKLFAEKYNLNYGSVKSSLRKETIYLKRYKIKYAASISNDSRKLGENGETLEVDNLVGSLESEKIVLKTAND